MSEEIVKIGIIGIGNMGSSHAQRIANGDIQGMKLVAVADRKENRREWAKESLPEDEVKTLPEEGGWDLVSSEDATIASIYTRQGTPQVEKGSAVSKGAILILGRLDIMDDN